MRIPKPLSTCAVRLEDDSMIMLRQHGNPTGPRLILSHGNGLSIDLYFPFWSLLLHEFEIIIHDVRNHGWNSLGSLQNHTIKTFVRDQRRVQEAIDAHFGAKPKIGVYHSLAAMVAILSLTCNGKAAEETFCEGGFKALILLDPPICMRGVSEEAFYQLAELAAARTRRKQSRFESMEEFEARVGNSSRFARVAAGVPHLLAKTTLRRSADGTGYELRCPPEYEAQVFECVRDWARLVNFRGVPCPVKVIGSDPSLPYAYVPTLEHDLLRGPGYEFLDGTTHLLPLEKPVECAAAVCAYLQQDNFA